MTLKDGVTLVTGASGGIGEALAAEFAAHGHDLALVARRETALRAVADRLADRHGVAATTIPMDLAGDGAADRLVSEVDERDLTVSVLVNNVGVGTYGPFVDVPPEDDRRLLDLNVVLLTELTKAFLPRMVERGHGRVLNVASAAAFQPGPLMATYYASKSYVLSFTEAIAEELRGTGVAATALCPGPVDTEFQERAGEAMVRSRIGSWTFQPVEDVARAGFRGTIRGKPVVIPGLPMKATYLASKLLPGAVLRRVGAWVNA